jgi:hypothetical protein
LLEGNIGEAAFLGEAFCGGEHRRCEIIGRHMLYEGRDTQADMASAAAEIEHAAYRVRR